ncbi:MAG: type II toxin-antitoxin system prevent-host-death family antitoxin [Proteobacteria bacterium]|jgi:prevent-host-death family protein|nr:type II toxin-antitoxin system prevent-host-death family antitoxin [Pseudomonadota bacterium]
MNKIISAAEANRRFSKLLKETKKGISYTITNHGEVVATLNPPAANDEDRERAWKEMLADLRKKPVHNIGPWTREELYERDPE